jgi:transcriptional regulator with XRE-family HTH domain
MSDLIPNRLPDAEAIGRRIREQLQRLGLSPKFLAEKTGIGQSSIYSILSGRHMPSPEKLRAICEAASMSIDTLLDVEPHLFSLFPEPHAEGRVYANFERTWFGERGGERISVSRGFSVANQSEALRRELLSKVYGKRGESLETAMNAFRERQEVIRDLERTRLEVVVKSEIEDFVRRREPWDEIDRELIVECIEGVIGRLESDSLGFEVVVIPRERFLVNYEIINREVILFDAGSVFLRHNHQRVLEHFLAEVGEFKTSPRSIHDRAAVVAWLRELLTEAAVAESLAQGATRR